MPRNGRTSNQDYVNLLYSDSESDPPDLKLPPLKGKRPKKKRLYQNDTSLCSLWSFAKIFVSVLLLASVVILGIISYWLQQQIQTLKDEMAAVENRNKGAPEELQKLHSQLQAVNKSIQDVRTGKQGLDQITKNITLVSAQVTILKSTVDNINENLNAGPGLKNVPASIAALSKSLADMGSDLGSTKAAVDDLKKNVDALSGLEARITSLEGNDRESPGRQRSTPAPVAPYQAAFSQRLEQLEQRVNLVNSSISTQFSMLPQGLQTYEFRIASLEEATKVLGANVTSLATQTASLSQLSMHPPNSTVSSGGTSAAPSVEESLPEGMRSLRNLMSRVDNISAIVSSLQDQILKDRANQSTVAGSASPDFQHHTQQDIRLLNASVGKLQEEVDHLFAKLNQQTNSLVVVNHTVSSIAAFLHASGAMNRGRTPMTGSATTVPMAPSASSTPAVSTPASTDSKTSTASQTLPAHSKIPETEAAPSSVPSTGLQVAGIETPEDLALNFHRWDIDGDGRVSYGDMKDHLGPSAPEESQLGAFDENADGKFSLQEMAAALGIQLPEDERQP